MSPFHPSLALLGMEPFRAAMEFATNPYHFMRPTARAGETGDGHPVVIFPGLGADGQSVATLREHCRALGYDAFDWGQGMNFGPTGDFDDWLRALQTRVTALLSGRAKPATLIGWSLGGLYARELGKLMPGQVRQVITIGTPFNSGAAPADGGWLYRLLGDGGNVSAAAMDKRLRTPPALPTMSIYSRSDGVVPWQACRHARPSARVQDVEVEGSHCGLAWNRDVLDAVAGRLR